MLYLLKIFKCLMSKKHSLVLNLQIKIVYNQGNVLKISHALYKHNTRFFGGFCFSKGKVSCYWIVIFLFRVIIISFTNLLQLFFFFKEKKLKKSLLVLKFLYFRTVLSLNSNVFCYFYFLVKTPLHCINLQREGTTFNQRI